MADQAPNVLQKSFAAHRLRTTALDPKLTFSQHINVTIIKAKRTLDILKALNSFKWGKQKELIVATFKAINVPFWNMQTPYGALSYQTPTLKNCKPFRTQFCTLPLAAHKA